jgi:hypothetical protein
MVSVALVKRSSAELFLSSEIHAFVAQHLKVRRGLYGRAHTHLTEDFGLDLFEILRRALALCFCEVLRFAPPAPSPGRARLSCSHRLTRSSANVRGRNFL